MAVSPTTWDLAKRSKFCHCWNREEHAKLLLPISDSKNGGKTTTKAKAKPKSLSEIVAAAKLKRKPSIVIVPKSLIFNWIEEAAKFTPRLRIANYTGTDRRTNLEETIADKGFDVLLTTYGTMRRDIADLSQIEFDYAILDESQAIKNSKGSMCEIESPASRRSPSGDDGNTD